MRKDRQSVQVGLHFEERDWLARGIEQEAIVYPCRYCYLSPAWREAADLDRRALIAAFYVMAPAQVAISAVYGEIETAYDGGAQSEDLIDAIAVEIRSEHCACVRILPDL